MEGSCLCNWQTSSSIGARDTDLDPQQRFGAIEAPSIVGHGSTWVPMGCAEPFVMRLPDNYNQAARDGLAHRPHTACGSRRSLALVSSIREGGNMARAPSDRS